MPPKRDLKKIGLFLTIFAAALLGGAVWLVLQYWDFHGSDTQKTPVNGGGIVATYRTEPRSFNRLIHAGVAENVVSRLVHDTLVRTDRKTGQLEARLATEWTPSADGRTWTVALRKDVVFSDGQPFTAADVLFSMKALYDPKVASQIASGLLIQGKPMSVRAIDDHAIVIEMPTTFGPGMGVFESIPILPAHKLGAALEAGKFQEAWSISTPPADVVGLGPFVVENFKSGEGMTFRKNPRFWKSDAEGRKLPYLDRIELQFTTNEDAEILRMQAGSADLITSRARVEDLASLQSLSSAGKIVLHEPGYSIGPDMFWFNLDPASKTARERPWIQREEFRHAVSQALDRTAVVNTVFLGEAIATAGPITPGHGEWYTADLVKPVYDEAAAKKALDAMGLVDRNGDGVRDDQNGKTASIPLLTQKGNTVRERTAEVIKEQLRRVGLQVDVVPMEFRALAGQIGSGEYDAAYFGTEFDSIDPGRALSFWLSSGSFHVWRPGQQTPGFPWEKELDSLMTRQVTTMDGSERRKIFMEAQRLLYAHQPVIYLAAQKVVVPTSSRLGGVTASVLTPNVLWNAEALFLKPDAIR